ncbi:MAG: glutathione S-transferase N-terminal domain-containing protein [SAR202 cluster bacterium]|nr:glutathione S-transferase N-terminal domain-containing protein [SAR202 cluster bacterium]
MRNKTTKITMYGTNWCGDCRRAKLFFSEHRIPYNWVNVDEDREASDLITEMNNGYRSVPTIVFDDGAILVEPLASELALKLGISSQG